MDYCSWKRICTHKIDCGEWYEVGTCDYYGHYMRNVRPEKQQYITKRPCKHLSFKPTKEHLKMCKTCKDRFICWTSGYWEKEALETHKWNVYHETIRKAREKVRSKEGTNT